MKQIMISLNNLRVLQDHQVKSKISTRIHPEKLPIYLGGGIGDVILNLQTVKKIKEISDQVEIYTRHPEVYNYFKDENEDPCLDVKEIPKFTWHMDICAVARFRKYDGFKEFNDTAKLLYARQKLLITKYTELGPIIADHPYFDNSLGRFAEKFRLNRKEMPLFSLGMETLRQYSPTYLGIPEGWVKPENYITIHDGFELESGDQVKGRATKTWNWMHWNRFVKLFKQKFPHIEIIQLGTKTARLIDGIDINLIEKTTITEAFDILKKSKLHIDGDSGLVHAATAMGIPCVVLFGPTPDLFYGHTQNINLRSTKTCEGSCWWLQKDWLSKCPAGLKAPVCMDDISSDWVMASVESLLA